MEDYLAICEQFKEEGNKELKNNHFDKAIELYSKAIQHANKEGSRVPKTKIAIFYANRAFAQIKLQNYGLATEDAQASVSYDPNYEKGYLRLAFSNEIVQHYKQAYSAYLKAFQLSGNKDQFIYGKLINCKAESQEYIKNKRLLMLHDHQDRGPKVEKPYKDWRQIEVGNEYTGPRLEEKEEVTGEWVVKLMQYFKEQKTLHKRYTLQLIQKCKNILKEYQSLVNYQIGDQEQFTICGDIHGQYYDAMNIFSLNGKPNDNNKYLFNGDFVDRGSFSVECILTLVAWKCVNKEWLHMTRGNHEAKQVNLIYGFKGEVEAKYKDNGVYEAFSEMFCALPLVYVFNQKVMVCHGGLPSEDNIKLKDIATIDRFFEPPVKGAFCDLLWADPAPAPGRTPSKRGASMAFGPDITTRFLRENDLDLLIRSHEVKQQGYEQTHEGRCITIFSAPNYCDFTGNKAAFIRLNGKTLRPKYTQFDAVPHPPVGPMAYASQFKGMF